MEDINLLGRVFFLSLSRVFRRVGILIWVDSVILTLFAGMLNLGSTIYGLVFLYAFFANAFFLVRLLHPLIPSSPHRLTPHSL
jgi:hypothetical protein